MARVTARGVATAALTGALKLLAIAAMIGLPLLGVWIASSLAALGRGPLWAALLAGLLLCPILPVTWEAWSAFRRARKRQTRPRILSTGDRTLFANRERFGTFHYLGQLEANRE